MVLVKTGFQLKQHQSQG